MGWTENAHGAVLLVRQKRGRKFWTLPGGKVLATETVEEGLRREILEETGVPVTFASQMALFDRPDKRNLTFLFRVALETGATFRPQAREIAEVAYHASLPLNASPSLLHFWQLLRGVGGM